MALDDEKAMRWFFGVIQVVLIALFAWWLLRPTSPTAPIPPSTYAGCYKAGSTLVRLTSDGRFRAKEGEWRFRVIPSSAGKYRDLIYVTGIEPSGTAESTAFIRSNQDRNWELQSAGGFQVDTGASFRPTPCEESTP